MRALTRQTSCGAETDPVLVPLWTSTGRGGTPEGFSPEVGNRFRFVGKTTQVTYRIEPHGDGTRFSYDHVGFRVPKAL